MKEKSLSLTEKNSKTGKEITECHLKNLQIRQTTRY